MKYNYLFDRNYSISYKLQDMRYNYCGNITSKIYKAKCNIIVGFIFSLDDYFALIDKYTGFDTNSRLIMNCLKES